MKSYRFLFGVIGLLIIILLSAIPLAWAEEGSGEYTGEQLAQMLPLNKNGHLTC